MHDFICCEDVSGGMTLSSEEVASIEGELRYSSVFFAINANDIRSSSCSFAHKSVNGVLDMFTGFGAAVAVRDLKLASLPMEADLVVPGGQSTEEKGARREKRRLSREAQLLLSLQPIIDMSNCSIWYV